MLSCIPLDFIFHKKSCQLFEANMKTSRSLLGDDNDDGLEPTI